MTDCNFVIVKIQVNEGRVVLVPIHDSSINPSGAGRIKPIIYQDERDIEQFCKNYEVQVKQSSRWKLN